MTTRTTRWALTLALLLIHAGCEGDGGGGGEGRLNVTIWGEDFIESGIPASELADDWAITFDRFLVSVGDLAASTGPDTTPAFADPLYRVYDLTKTTGPVLVATGLVPAGAYGHFDYTIAPAADSVAGNAGPDDVTLMHDGGFGVYVEGNASDGTTTVRFAWGFTESTVYTACQATAVVGEGGAAATTQMTIHGDHFFYDDLADEDPALRFATLAAADADADAEVTRAELAAVAGTDFVALDNYGAGTTDVSDLDAYVTYLMGTLGHIDGEGHCGE